MKLFKKAPQREACDYDILEEIEQVKAQMDTAYSNFQNAVDPDLIDCCIYESNAAWKKIPLSSKAGEITVIAKKGHPYLQFRT